MRPVVLSFSGHDPSGGAGIQADIETLVSHQCHSVSVITALTEQDSTNVKLLIPQKPENIRRQAELLLQDFNITVFKIGLLGHIETVKVVHEILKQNPAIPVIFDPVLAAGGGTELSSADLISAISLLLLPLTTVLTPNTIEARRLAEASDLAECGRNLLARGCAYVLITGTHEDSAAVNNQLFHGGTCIETYAWNRLQHEYHGSGCTLAASIAGLLARGLPVIEAITEAQEYTWNALLAGYRPGKGQYNPDRLFWMEEA